MQATDFKQLINKGNRVLHTKRVVHQFHDVKQLKDNLPDGHVIIQMDFAENYSCRSFEKVLRHKVHTVTQI